jgi:hypothetical protein
MPHLKDPVHRQLAPIHTVLANYYLLAEADCPLVHLESIGELQPGNRQRSTGTIVGHDLPREEMANSGLDD